MSVAEFQYPHRLWDDMRVPFTALISGASAPDFAQVIDDGAGSTGIFAFLFDKMLEEELFFTAQLPHGYKAGTDLKPHIHWAPTDTDTGAVVWGIEYAIFNKGATPPSVSTIMTASEAAPGTALMEEITGLGTIDGTDIRESTQVIGRVFRMAGSGDDTYDADAIGFELDFHYQAEKPGTFVEFPS